MAAPQTLGDHLKRYRRDRGQLQREAAVEIGVNIWTYMGWETDGVMPSVAHMPCVVEYLGYDPLEKAETFGAWLRAARRRHGMTRAELARRLGVNPSTVEQWEQGICRPRQTHMAGLEGLFGKKPTS